jgi:hypothetical protein
VRVDESGNLVVTLPTTSTTTAPPALTELAPHAWQTRDGRQVAVAAEYVSATTAAPASRWAPTTGHSRC